ncbi:MAG TPA: hypothetical protein VKX17_23585 [Planctomycetota bacterium]|nr:hypothetical protein [Planctomycetota bacterium]
MNIRAWMAFASVVCTFLTASNVKSADGIEISATFVSNSGVIVEGEPIDMLIKIKNGTGNVITAFPMLPFETVDIKLVNSKKNEIVKTNYGKSLVGLEDTGREMKKPMVLNPGQSVEDRVPLWRIFDISMPGVYDVNLKYIYATRQSVECDIPLTIMTESALISRNQIQAIKEKREAEQRQPLVPKGKDVDYTAPPKDAPHSLTIKSSIDKFALGSSPVRVTYANNSSAGWTLVMPEIVSSSIVHYSALRNPDKKDRYAPNAPYFGIVRRANMQKLLVASPQPKIELKPGESTEFALDIYSVPADWQPGEYELWIHNDAESIGSNKIKFKLDVNSDSVAYLLEMADKEPDSKDPLENHHQQMRYDFAVNWLIKTFPDLPLNPITDRDAQNVVDAKYEQNHHFIAEFREKWKTRKDTPEIKALFEKLNAGK